MQNNGRDMPVPGGTFVRAQLLTRLREATELVGRALETNLERLAALLDDVATRVEALRLPGATLAATRAAEADAGDVGSLADEAQDGAIAVLRAAALADGATPASEFLLVPFGDVIVERPVAGSSFVFTATHAQAAVQWFEALGRKLAIDYEHQSFGELNTRADGLRPAAGWIGGLAVRDDGLWAVDVTWTPRATELLRSGEYRYFSPVIFWSDAEYTEVAGLGPVALTNDPAMHGVTALAAGREADCADQGTAAEGTTACAADESRLQGGASELVAARQALAAAQAEITSLEKTIAGQAADAFVERGLRLGKIVDATSLDWRDDYLRDAEATEARLVRAPVLLAPGRVVAVDRRGQVLPLQTTRAASPLLVGQCVVEAEDLAAYERALAAGRVLVRAG